MASNTFTKGYADGNALTAAMLDTAYQTLQLDISNTPLLTTGSTSGQALISNGSAIAASFQTIADPQGPFALRNYGIKATVAAGVMTVTLTTKAGTAPSGSDVVNFSYGTNGVTSATYTTINITSAVTLTVNSSASLGINNTATNRVYVYTINNAGAARLAVSTRSDMDMGGAVLTVAMSATSDSGSVLYATAALTVVPRLLGWVDVAQNSVHAWQTPSKTAVANQVPALFKPVPISSSSGDFNTTSTTFVPVTNLTLSVSTTGRSVRLELISASNTADNSACIWTNDTDGKRTYLSFVRDASIVRTYVHNAGADPQFVIPANISCVDIAPAAGTYTYTVQLAAETGSTATIRRVQLVAYEI